MQQRRKAPIVGAENRLIFRVAVAIVLFLLVLSEGSRAKCALIFVLVEGTVESAGHCEQLEVAISLIPEPNRDLPNPEIVEGEFKSKISFDPTAQGAPTRHYCSRTPEEVVVRLLTNGEVVDKPTLSIESDFARTPEGDFMQTTSLILTDRRPELETPDSGH